MTTYRIKKLIFKNRGLSEGQTGYFGYSLDKISKYEQHLVKTPDNLKRFEEFKKATLNKTPIRVKDFYMKKYVGVVLDNNMVINFIDDSTKLLGEYDKMSTPKGRVQIYYNNSKYIVKLDKNIPENLENLEEPLYELDYNDNIETLIYVKKYTFLVDENLPVTPKVVCQVPNYWVRPIFVPYFHTTTVRAKLFKKLKQICPQADLKTILDMDKELPKEYLKEHEDWTPERRLYNYLCKNSKYCYEYFDCK